jgi:hypothetical protein
VDYGLRFSERHIYDSRPERYHYTCGAESGGKTIELLAKIDTGASDCLFEHAYGEVLGLRVEEGFAKRIRRQIAGLKHTGTKSRFRFSALRARQRSTFLPIRASSGMYSGAAVGLTGFASAWWTTSKRSISPTTTNNPARTNRIARTSPWQAVACTCTGPAFRNPPFVLH